LDVHFGKREILWNPLRREAAGCAWWRLIEGELPLEEKQPLSWPDFLSILEAYCHLDNGRLSTLHQVTSWTIFARGADDKWHRCMSHEAVQKLLPFAEEADDLRLQKRKDEILELKSVGITYTKTHYDVSPVTLQLLLANGHPV